MLKILIKFTQVVLLGDYCWYRYSGKATKQVFYSYSFLPNDIEHLDKSFYMLHIGLWFCNLQIVERGFYDKDTL